MLSRIAVLVVAFSFVMTGCGQSETDISELDPIALQTAEPVSREDAISPPIPAPIAASTNVSDCFDADCALAVTGPMDIPLDPELVYYSEMSIVVVTPGSLSYRVDYPYGGGAQRTLRPGGGSAFGFSDFTKVDVALDSTTNGTAVLMLTPSTSG